MSENSLEACIRAWRTSRPFPEVNGGEDFADAYFSRGQFEAAVKGYAACAPQSERIQAKRGWCLALLDHCQDAAQYLTPENCGSSSAELAVLAAVVAGDWQRHKLYRRPNESAEDALARKQLVTQLVLRALDAPGKPDQLAFFAYMDLLEWWEDREAALAVAERGIALFKSPSLMQWHALLLRTLGRPDDASFNALLTYLPDEPSSAYVGEVLESALALSRYDDASAALDMLEEKLRPEQDATFDVRVMLMRSYVDLRRALDADPGAAVRGLVAADDAIERLSTISRDRDAAGWLSLFASKLRLALAVIAKDDRGIRESAKSIIDITWAADTAPDYSPEYQEMFVGGVVHGANFGSGHESPTVVAALDPENQLRWKLVNALHAVIRGDDARDQAKELIAAAGHEAAPNWASDIVAELLLTADDVDARAVGYAIARHSLHVARVHESYATAPELHYDHLSAAQLSELVQGIEDVWAGGSPKIVHAARLLMTEVGSVLVASKAYLDVKRLADRALETTPDDPTALFYAALARQELQQLGDARRMYERLLELKVDHHAACWNLTLIYQAQGDVDAIDRTLPRLREFAATQAKEWVDVRDLAQAARSKARQQHAKTDFRAFVSGELASFSPLRDEAIDVNELSLLEAASLIALLRACDLDHSSWTLSPFGISSNPFEPTNRFRTSLFDLARKGIIRISESTPVEAFTERDGDLRYFLDRVQWSIGPRTLAVQIAIRDRSRRSWPAHWSAHVEVLARDLATEECVAYMEYLAEQRGLDAPDRTDSRGVLRELLEHASVAKCWYYVYSGVQSANDYRTKYAVSPAQVTAMMLRRTRERGEAALANGWETKHRRIGALPRSHLSAALHDVLTGWGDRAFEESIRTLADPGPGGEEPTN